MLNALILPVNPDPSAEIGGWRFQTALLTVFEA
jgi:hypothetical protein